LEPSSKHSASAATKHRQLGAVERAKHVGGGQVQQLGTVERAEHVDGGFDERLGAVE